MEIASNKSRKWDKWEEEGWSDSVGADGNLRNRQTALQPDNYTASHTHVKGDLQISQQQQTMSYDMEGFLSILAHDHYVQSVQMYIGALLGLKQSAMVPRLLRMRG